MRFDTIIIGGGLSGMTCAAMLAKGGHKVGLVTTGKSTLQFNSGSFDLMGYVEGQAVEHPLEALKQLPEGHPYHKIGDDKIDSYIEEAKKLLEEAGLTFKGTAEKNHFRLSPIGVLKPTWLTLDTLFTVENAEELKEKKLLLANIEGFLDWPMPYLSDSLLTLGAEVRSVTFTTDILEFARTSTTEMRATNIAKYLQKPERVKEIAQKLNAIAEDCDCILMPAVLGLHNEKELRLLQNEVQKPIQFVATMPPSVPGNYIQNRLTDLLHQLGVVIFNSDTVESGRLKDNRLVAVTTEKLEETLLEADQFVLATGSFISGGLVSNYETICEPILNCDINTLQQRDQWTSEYLFDEHAYMGFGIQTDDKFHVTKEGKTIENVFAVGSVLSGNNSIRQANGTGVSMLTAINVAHNILNIKDHAS